MTHQDVSITDRARVEAVISERKPDVVFNCAAYNAVDLAESERDAAFAANAQGPENIAAACRKHAADLVHFSTNFVFSGDQDEAYIEADEPVPISIYGQSKLAGERAVVEVGAHVLVVRTAAIFGGPGSFPMRILEREASGHPVRVVSDQRVNPTYARDLAQAAVELAEARMTGIVHAVAEGCCGWDEFAKAALDEAGVMTPVESVLSSGYPTPARRPKNGCLASTRFRPLRPWREALHEALNP